MKKYIILLIMFIFPHFVDALYCDLNKVTEYKSISSNVFYDIAFNEETKNFEIDFYNLLDDMYIVHSNIKYNLISNEQLGGKIISISNLKEGTNQKFEIKKDMTYCENLMRVINLKLPYINTFYSDDRCTENKDFELCNKFLSNKITKTQFDKAIEEYIESKKEIEEEVLEVEIENYFLKIIASPYLYVSVIVIASSMIIYLYFYERKQDLF